MTKPLSKDIRVRLVSAVEGGQTELWFHPEQRGGQMIHGRRLWAYLQAHPDGKYAVDARRYVARCLAKLGRHAEAAKEYGLVGKIIGKQGRTARAVRP